MPPSDPPSAEAFWRWAAARYARAPAAWLALQAAGGNVNLALLLAWFDEAGESAPELDLLERASAPLDTVLREFRTLRHRLKPALDTPDYQALLAHELALEREQQARLLAACVNADASQIAGAALERYLIKLGIAADHAMLITPTI